jgi:hypothetical protein
MIKQLLILKDSHTKITTHSTYMEIKSFKDSYIVSYMHLKAIYLNKSIDIDISTCYELSQKVPLFIIDQNGYILATLKEVDDEEV